MKIHNILKFVPKELRDKIDDIMFVACALTNLQPRIIKVDHEDSDTED